MLQEIIKVSDRVEYVLENYPKTRDSDTLLWLTYMVVFHDVSTKVNNAKDSFKEMANILLKKQVPAIESIGRARRKIQEAGRWVGTVRDERKALEKKVSDWAVGG